MFKKPFSTITLYHSSWVLKALFLAPLPFLFYKPIADPDFWWHLASGRWMWEHRAILSTDVFSFTRYGEEWINFEWLAQILYYGTYQLGGFPLLIIFKVGLFVVVGYLFYRHLLLGKLDAHCRWFAFTMAIYSITRHSDLRPENFTLLFTVLVLYLCEYARTQSARWALWLIPGIMLLWVNVHGGFILAPIVLGIYAVGQWLNGWYLSGRALGPSFPRFPYGWCLAACIIISLCNPYGMEIWLIPIWHHLMMTSNPDLISEWTGNSLTLKAHWPLWILLFSAFFFFLIRFLRTRAFDFTRFLLLVAAGFMAAGTVRYAVFFSLMALPAVAKEWTLFCEESPSKNLVQAGRVTAVLCMASLWLWGVPKFFPTKFLIQTDDKHRPRYVSHFMMSHGLGGSVLNTWEDGGYLTWHYYGKIKVFYDGRYIFVPDLMEFKRSQGHPSVFKGFLKKHDIEVALLSNRTLNHKVLVQEMRGQDVARSYRSPLVYYFPKPEWALVYWDDNGFLLVRRQKKHEELIRSYEYQWVDPVDDEFLLAGLKEKRIPEHAVRQELTRAIKQSPRNRLAMLLWEILFEKKYPHY